MQALMKEKQPSDPHIDSRREELRLLLDEAIGALSQRDRIAVLARFFEEKSFREIGQLLGKTEEAALMNEMGSIQSQMNSQPSLAE